jgi:PAS domain S-box-containing protein
MVEIGLNPLVRGDETFVLASIVDITERKQSERAIRESEERFRLLMSGVRDYAIFLLDPDGYVESWDQGAERIKGYTKDEIIGKHFSKFYPNDEIIQGKPAADLQQAATHDRFEDEGWRVRKDESRFYANNVIAAVKDDQGKLLGFAKVTRDITERKRSETLLQHKILELERSNDDLHQFAYVCSHDLQEPLRVISNYTQLLVKRYSGRVLDESATDFVDFILDATVRMQGLINDLLLYSRVQTRGERFNEVDCQLVVESALSNLKVALEEAQITVHKHSLPTLLADRSQLTQVFQNLLGNAVKFRSKEHPQIDISAREDPDFWTFTVRDNGVGFDIKYADRIFVIFQRLHTKETYPGSGIGLAICKKIVERHGGRIWVESSEGQGSAFHFTIPKRSATTGT